MSEMPERLKQLYPKNSLCIVYQPKNGSSMCMQMLWAIQNDWVFIRICETMRKAQNAVNRLRKQLRKIRKEGSGKYKKLGLDQQARLQEYKIYCADNWVMAVPIGLNGLSSKQGNRYFQNLLTVLYIER